jgi:hypothetical protein
MCAFLSRIVMLGLAWAFTLLVVARCERAGKRRSSRRLERASGQLSFQRQLLSLFVFSKGKLIHGIRMDDSDPALDFRVTSLNATVF